MVTASTYRNLAYFTKTSRKHGEKWIISALSFTGADQLRWNLEESNLTDGVIMTQVVPLLDSDLPIVQEARAILGENLGMISLEGYILGKMLLQIMRDIPGELTRENFLQQVAQSRFNLGGILIDFTDGNNQASELVIISHLHPEGFAELNLAKFSSMLK